MSSYKLTVEYQDEDGDMVVDEVVVEGDNFASVQDEVAENIGAYFDDAEESPDTDPLILSITEA